MAAALHCPACGHEIRPPRDERLAVGGLVLYPHSGTAFVYGRSARLRRAPCAVLAALMRYPRQVSGFEYLMDASATASIQSLRVRMLELRGVIGTAAEIRNTEGFGYSIHPIDEENMAKKPDSDTPPEPGAKFNEWTVLGVACSTRRGQTVLNVQCSCGTRREVVMREVVRGKSKSCGCSRRKQGHQAVYQLRGKLHRNADGTGPRLVYGARPKPGGTILDPDVKAFMRKHGVTRVEPGERALEPAEP